MAKQHPFSIWFVIGLLLSVYGLIILITSVYEYFVPTAHPVVMNQLHAGIWWGALLIAMGIFYTIRFYPKKGKS
jgi:hypothetical protein